MMWGILMVNIGWANGMAPNRRQAITWTYAGLFSVGLLIS